MITSSVSVTLRMLAIVPTEDVLLVLVAARASAFALAAFALASAALEVGVPRPVSGSKIAWCSHPYGKGRPPFSVW